MPKTLTPEIVLAAIAGFELQKAKLDSQIAELRSMLDGSGRSESPSTPTGRPRKKFSAATRRKMAAAQRARYSKLRQGSEPTQPVIAKPRRKLSAKGRRAISIAAKKRWKAIKAAKKAA
jgi:hypothetical protein